MILELPAGAPRLSLRWVDDGAAHDVVGHLLAANDDWYVLLPEDRPAVWVPRTEARGVRRVPERNVLPVSRPEDLERALERARRSGRGRSARIGGWWLSEHGVLALGDPGADPDDALGEAEEWCGGPVPVRALPGGAADALTALGFAPTGGIVVLTCTAPLAALPGAVALTRGWGLEVAVGDTPSFDAAVGAGFSERYRVGIFARP